MKENLIDVETQYRAVEPFKLQLLKWIGNKQRFAHEIATYFPADMGAYFEPFLGSGAVLGTLAPKRAVAADVFPPLMEIWKTLHDDVELLKEWYSARWHSMMEGEKIAEYERVKASYNAKPNGADLLFLCRSCYGGVVRFRKTDGYMSTPCGVHKPISPTSFANRAEIWRRRTAGVEFILANYKKTMERARKGDLVYCDPPYKDTQSILYGAQDFDLYELFQSIESCKSRGVRVALSIDGTKQSGNRICDVPIPPSLFDRQVFVNCGRSMLRRFQKLGETLEGEVVKDRLLLTY